MKVGQIVLSSINFNDVIVGMKGEVIGPCNDSRVNDATDRFLVRFENGRFLNMHFPAQISMFFPTPQYNALSSMRERSVQDQPVKEKHSGAQDDDIGTSMDASPFVDYQAGREALNYHGFAKHTDPVVESSSLSAVIPPAPTYRFKLPLKTLTEGRLTNLQIESLVYACTQHEKFLPSGHRMGFFMGDGPGLGKGRQIAGIIFENFLRGRKRSVWLSTSGDLIEDAKRDLSEVGAGRIRVHDLRGYHIAEDLRKKKELKQGVLFVTYHLLVGVKGDQSRLKQILQWCGLKFEGVLALDECHSAKNLSVKRGKNGSEIVGGSKAAVAVHMLQDHLKNARVIYVSATGASKPDHLVYASRLGLWGKGTAFKNSENFVSEINAGGVAAMELLAIQMKASGQYLARSLAFKGATFEVVNLSLNEEFVEMYDKAAELWLDFISALNVKLETQEMPLNLRKSKLLQDLWGTHQRFWCTMCISAKVPGILEIVERELKEGKCVVIGLQKTGESAISKFNASCDPYSEIGDGGRRTTHWAEIPSTAKAIFLRFVSKTSNFMGDEWIQKVQQLKLPPNPLDFIIHSLGGVGKVAEMTGRSKRVVSKNNHYELVSRGTKVGLDTVNVRERKRFQTGKKLIAIISEAASTGISLQSDKRVLNQRRRVHITLELPWSAEKAIQQMGRTHRSNQSCPPEFKLVMTPIGGEWRFSSTVARKLQALGALTHGDRLAAGGASSLNHFAIADSKYGHQAIAAMLNKLKNDDVARTCLQIVGIDRGCQTNVKVFLNRLLGIPLDSQKKVFEAWMDEIEAAVFRAKSENVYSEGIVDIAAQSMVLENEEVVYKMKDGRETSHIRIRGDRGVSWEKALDLLEKYSRSAQCGFYKGAQSSSNEKCMLLLRRETHLRQGGSFQVIRPNVGFTSRDLPNSALDSYDKISHSEAKALWEKDFNYFFEKCGHTREEVCPGEACTYRKRKQHYDILSGFVLAFWEIIRNQVDTVKIVRVILDCGRKIVGLLMPANIVPVLLQKIKEHGKAIEDKETMDMVAQRRLKVDAIHRNWMMNVSKKVPVAGVDLNEEHQEASGAESEGEEEEVPVFKSKMGKKKRKRAKVVYRRHGAAPRQSGEVQLKKRASGPVILLESDEEEQEVDENDDDDDDDPNFVATNVDPAMKRKSHITPEEVTGIGKELQSIGLWEPSPESDEFFDDGTWGQDNDVDEDDAGDEYSDEEEEDEEFEASNDNDNTGSSRSYVLRSSRADVSYYEDTETEEEQSSWNSDVDVSESDSSNVSSGDLVAIDDSEPDGEGPPSGLEQESPTLTCAGCKAALPHNDAASDDRGGSRCSDCAQHLTEDEKQALARKAEESSRANEQEKSVRLKDEEILRQQPETRVRGKEDRAPFFVLEFMEIELIPRSKKRRVDFRAIASLPDLMAHVEHKEKLLLHPPEVKSTGGEEEKPLTPHEEKHAGGGAEEVSPAAEEVKEEGAEGCDQAVGDAVAAEIQSSSEQGQSEEKTSMEVEEKVDQAETRPVSSPQADVEGLSASAESGRVAAQVDSVTSEGGKENKEEEEEVGEEDSKDSMPVKEEEDVMQDVQTSQARDQHEGLQSTGQSQEPRAEQHLTCAEEAGTSSMASKPVYEVIDLTDD